MNDIDHDWWQAVLSQEQPSKADRERAKFYEAIDALTKERDNLKVENERLTKEVANLREEVKYWKEQEHYQAGRTDEFMGRWMDEGKKRLQAEAENERLLKANRILKQTLRQFVETLHGLDVWIKARLYEPTEARRAEAEQRAIRAEQQAAALATALRDIMARAVNRKDDGRLVCHACGVDVASAPTFHFDDCAYPVAIAALAAYEEER